MRKAASKQKKKPLFCSLLLTVSFVSVLDVGLNVCFLVNENCIYLFIYIF